MGKLAGVLRKRVGPYELRRDWGMGLLVICVLGVCAAWGQEASHERSVVWIRSVKQGYDYTTPWKQLPISQGIGTGFIIEGNRILTNAHNVSDVRYVEVKKQNEAKRYLARVEYVGHDCDLAILRISDAGFFEGTTPLELGPLPVVNTTVSTYGFPVGGQHISVTEGVVSRIQMDTYSHPVGEMHLVIQTDAAINPGNSGGPVLQDGKVVGVAFQGLAQADNIGYLIPTTVIRHFLKDIEDGRYDSYGSLGFGFYPGLHSESYKAYLKVPPDEQGIVVLKTLKHSSVEGILEAGDVMTHIDGFDIDNDGMIHIHGLRLHLAEAVENKQIGDTIQLTFIRQGDRITKEVTIALNRPIVDYTRQYDRAPDYVVHSGLTFVALSRNFLETWGRNWRSAIPAGLRYLFRFANEIDTDPQRKEYVILSEILPDAVNVYSKGFRNQPIESINEKAIWSLRDVQDAMKESKEGFYVLKFLGNPQVLVLDIEQNRQRHDVIMQKYGVPSESRLEAQ